MHLKSLRVPAAAATLGVALVLAMLAQSGTGQGVLRSLGIVAGPERFTELAFAEPLALPSELPAMSTASGAPFVITDREGRTERYSWRVVERASQIRALASSTVTLGPGQASYINPPLVFGCTGPRVEVDVLLSSGEHIGFAAQCKTRAAPASALGQMGRRRRADASGREQR